MLNPHVPMRERNAIAAVPGVVSVAWASQMPMSRSGSSSSVRIKADQPKETATPAFYYAQPGFVATMGLKIVEGRDMNDGDVVETDPQTAKPGEGAPDGALITRALAKLMWPDATSYVWLRVPSLGGAELRDLGLRGGL